MNFYVTFPQRLEDRKNKYVKIEAPTRAAAHDIAFARLGSGWAFLYEETEFLPQINDYGLTELEEW